MSAFDLARSLEAAAARFGPRTERTPRADRGASRLDPRVERRLHALLRGQDRPAIATVVAELRRFCGPRRLRAPSRATVYNAIARVPSHAYAFAELPAYVRDALYNLDGSATVPGHQLAFYAFQYGDTRAMSFAAGLPWIDLVHADHLRGWRPRSHGLLRAVLARRGIA
ncbi:MAG: hypothetical protein HYZ27_02065 [Deltaproteobacteria bacterium]|nr:hypothetical protein [Deltaproteobacteria bacterium]